MTMYGPAMIDEFWSDVSTSIFLWLCEKNGLICINKQDHVTRNIVAEVLGIHIWGHVSTILIYDD